MEGLKNIIYKKEIKDKDGEQAEIVYVTQEVNGYNVLVRDRYTYQIKKWSFEREEAIDFAADYARQKDAVGQRG